ncbi:peptide deformylase [Geminocystis sp. GBBB08]|uniref:peptide deformylase n=1 Tax=Geminocystis sp. GBBB08 TaxID=2604140 RepID=UPI0027E341D1|nr:peptide deformylase [Geminocystis sp. GBBB08]MBL1209323.1 peptide deformylase [Geminocystis sp. GBBB08]
MTISLNTEILQIGNPILREIATEVTEIDNPKIQTLIDELILTTKEAHGVGIAAPQIGKSYRIIIVASHPNFRYPDAPFMSPIAMINPRIVSHSEEIVIATEGCLSVKEKRGCVPRYRDIVVEYITRDGYCQRQEYSNFVARIIQHELDHLNGILFVDYLQDKLTIIDS